MTTPTAGRLAQHTREASRAAIALLRDSGYATVGATDSAIGYVRRLGQKANEVRGVLADLATLRTPSELSASLRGLSGSVEQHFDSFAGRGRELVESLQRNRSVQQALGRSRAAGRHADAAVATACAPAKAGGEAGQQVVEAVSDDTAPGFESMTVEELRALARARGIEGRSEMNKAQLIEALRLP